MNLLDPLINLFAILLGASITWVTSSVLYCRQSKAREFAVLQSKIEALVTACSEIPDWTLKSVQFHTFRENALLSPDNLLDAGAPDVLPSALSKIRCMQRMYFAKELAEQTKALGTTIRDFSAFAHNIAIDRIQRDDADKSKPFPQATTIQQKKLEGKRQKVLDAQEKLITVAIALNHELAKKLGVAASV